MSIEAMKQALWAMERIKSYGNIFMYRKTERNPYDQAVEAITALRQAIAEAEKQEPVAIGEEWKPCVKLPIIVHVREQRKGETHVSTREGITPVKEDDLIMRGVAGEEYPIGRELFNRTYTFDTAPVHASDISQERVDETAKREHEFEEMVKKGTKAWADTPDDWVDDLRGGAEKQEPVEFPVVHEVRCTYPQCQATNGCVGACSKGQAEKQEPVSELLKLMAEDGVTGVLIEVHRGPLSKSIRTWGECDCPTSTDSDVTIEVQP